MEDINEVVVDEIEVEQEYIEDEDWGDGWVEVESSDDTEEWIEDSEDWVEEESNDQEEWSEDSDGWVEEDNSEDWSEEEAEEVDREEESIVTQEDEKKDTNEGSSESSAIARILNLEKDSFVTRVGEVNFDDLSFVAPLKNSRNTTYKGLTQSVMELSVLNPIHVMQSELYSDWLKGDKSTPFEGCKYIVLDGLRRIYAAMRNGMTSCSAVIWDFKDKEVGSQLAVVISLILNKTQRRSWQEIWGLYQVLERQVTLSPGNIEYLLQLESGDAMKLKDIMLGEYEEVKEELIADKKTLQQAYNMLQKLRRDEDKLEKEDNIGVGEIEEAESIVDVEETDRRLSPSEVRRILEMGNEFDGDLTEEDFDELSGANIADYRQTTGEREPLDPALRAAVLTRDGYCCQVSGMGSGLPAELALSILNVHHKISVANGGTDEMDNLITVSLDVHTLIHVLIKKGGKLGMKKEDFDKLDEVEREKLKNIMKIARFDLEAGRALGRTLKDFREQNRHTSKFEMPGAVLGRNKKALEGYANSEE